MQREGEMCTQLAPEHTLCAHFVTYIVHSEVYEVHLRARSWVGGAKFELLRAFNNIVPLLPWAPIV